MVLRFKCAMWLAIKHFVTVSCVQCHWSFIFKRLLERKWVERYSFNQRNCAWILKRSWLWCSAVIFGKDNCNNSYLKLFNSALTLIFKKKHYWVNNIFLYHRVYPNTLLPPGALMSSSTSKHPTMSCPWIISALTRNLP